MDGCIPARGKGPRLRTGFAFLRLRSAVDLVPERLGVRGGFVEIHPHCGGANSCGGFSFDETIGVFSEHNCAGLNTCTGYTCVLP